MPGKDKKNDSKHIKCDIQFDGNPTGVYKPGETVSGKVELTLEKNKKFRGICLCINGFAATYWSVKLKNELEKKRKTHFKGREDYFSTINYLVGSDVGNPLEVVAGTYHYPFSCVIPANAPTSMEGRYGHIRYLVKLSLERPWKHDIVYEREMTVRGIYDLIPHFDTLSMPSQAEAMTSFYFGFTEPLVVSASISKSGFAPGDIIELTVHVNNQSSVDVRTIVMKLQRVDTFISQIPRVDQYIERTVLEERTTSKISKRSDISFEENILVGAGIPSDVERCRIIQIKYEVEIIVHPIRSRKRLVLNLPIVLGTTSIANMDAHVERVVDKQREALEGFSPTQPSAPQSEDGPRSVEERRMIFAARTLNSMSCEESLDLENEKNCGAAPY
ncbi:arrestin domain-containing protein 17-like [Culex pipiens pallens]|uniref:arrestin domain-containing protein 17-like n=1 Tax=Culex pipiens pallens TaxID=42434 RepID=UPI001954D21C|nr:arrestin domain-containing protein 17-like [Culex pipiens pallens]